MPILADAASIGCIRPIASDEKSLADLSPQTYQTRSNQPLRASNRAVNELETLLKKSREPAISSEIWQQC
ncbi:hypothetical protein [Aureimonas sp. AU40]|uniref:hypothetical protein n=1 Tax=Aureimonas sp. AU40 TaxID=1637747 RepID=UPI0012E3D631|nr:hypothetical protein [Aureimonas sp. AU40]